MKESSLLKKIFKGSSVIEYLGALCCFVIIICLFTQCVEKETNQETAEQETFFSDFLAYGDINKRFRVGAELDTLNVRIKAFTTATFDSVRYCPQTLYVITYQSEDSLVRDTGDGAKKTIVVDAGGGAPLLSYAKFVKFYNDNKELGRADTIVSPSVLEKFFIKKKDRKKVDVESFMELPFVFMDVSFKGYPSLLVREGGYRDIQYYKTYGISKTGFKLVKFEPYNSIKSRAGTWMFGGSTEFDYDKNSITVHTIAEGSCSDFGVFIETIYTLDPKTDRFVKKVVRHPYDCCNE